MTRIWICQAETLTKLEEYVNTQIEHLETDGYGVKTIIEPSRPAFASGYSLVIVYGNGPTTTQRWSGAHE